MRNEVLHRVQGGQVYPAYNKKREANWIGHILRRNCILNTLLKER
jgi:hypothetical protein